MSEHSEVALRIATLMDELGRDNAFASKRLQIAYLFLRIGDKDNAAEWFLKAAQFAFQCDNGNAALSWAIKALELRPDDPVTQSVVADYKRRFELSPSTFKLPDSFYKKKV
jgi:hypothetical protein